jgi:hypothetical protein
MTLNELDNPCSELLSIILPIHDEGSSNNSVHVNFRQWRRIITRGVELGGVISEIVMGFQDRCDIIFNLIPSESARRFGSNSVAERIDEQWMTLRVEGDSKR